jgi:hypothetical protein
MGYREWPAKAWVWAKRTWSEYKQPHPIVIMRHAATDWDEDGKIRITGFGDAKLILAAEVIQARYGEGWAYRVYGTCSTRSQKVEFSARRLAHLLSAGEPEESTLVLSRFLAEIRLEPGVIPVVVTIEPEVEDAVMWAYGTDDPEKADPSISLTIVHGEPRFFRLEQAKRPDIAQERYHLLGDNR